jgi:serine/threonine protein kinase
VLAVKFAETSGGVQLIKREAAIHKQLKHPSILNFRGYFPEWTGRSISIVTEFAANGSLAGHLPSVRGAEMCQLRGETRVARIIVGIVLAMRYLHSQGAIHCDLSPDNILLDWDWNVRICDFGHSISRHQSGLSTPNDPDINQLGLSIDSHYLAPECYDDHYGPEIEVFSFGLIPYELMVRKPAFPKNLTQFAAAKRLVVDNERPIIPDFVLPAVQRLIRQCWKRNPWRRPTFNQILDQLDAMEFKLTANVKSSKLSEFVKGVKDWEESNDALTTRAH